MTGRHAYRRGVAGSRPRRPAGAAAGAGSLALGIGIVVYGGLGSPADDTGAHIPVAASRQDTSPATTTPAAAPLARSEPVRVRMAAAGVDTGPLLRLGLRSDGSVQVPSVAQADRMGWYTGAVTPGERGPAVLIGHFDTVEGPAVLRDISRMRPGDTILVDRADGRQAEFTVRELQQVPKDRFPTERVYGDTSTATLRVVTCGGALTDGHRPDNIIVYAELTRTR
ncbi:class F sortase [Streptomyces sp. NPDC002476]|uniref:class F sortase n=1 Tax=Streptomyces sp. NPDC002476 TaxID=3364648 RepID=UPI00368BF1E2